MPNFGFKRRISRAILVGVLLLLAGPAMAQMTMGAKGGLKIQPDSGGKDVFGQQIATLELTLAADARKPGSRAPWREVLDQGLVVRNTGRDALQVVYVGYQVKGDRIVNRSVSKPSLLEPGTHRVPAGRFLPGVEIRSGSGDGIIAGNEKLWSVDGGIIVGREKLGDIRDEALSRAKSQGNGTTTLVLFVVPQESQQRTKVGIRPVSIALHAP